MREIKFRGKRLDNGSWAFGPLLLRADGNAEICVGDDLGAGVEAAAVIPGTVGQFTGFRDKYGREIYEGDVITWLAHRVDGVGFMEMGHVEWRQCENAYIVVNRFATRDGRESIRDLTSCVYDVTVKGNIFDNPELAEGGAG